MRLDGGNEVGRRRRGWKARVRLEGVEPLTFGSFGTSFVTG